ncbi:unnamed protein product [Scytosiphon promiscuus]
MSPRAVDHGTRAAASPSPVVFHSQQHHAPVAAHHHHDGQDGGMRFRKPKKPLSSGFKAIVWTSAPPVGIKSTASPLKAAVVVSSHRRGSPPGAPASPAAPAPSAPSPDGRISADPHHRGRDDHGGDQHANFVAPAPHRTDSGRGSGRGRRRSPPTAAPAPLQHSAKQQNRLADISESRGLLHTGDAAEASRISERTQRFASLNESDVRRVLDRRSVSEEFSGQPERSDYRTGGSLHIPPARPDQDIPPAALPAELEAPAGGIDSSSASMPLPSPSRISSSTTPYPHANDIVMERSLSDSSVVTASDFGGSRSQRPIILSTATAMSDEEAVAELSSLLSRGKGLPVVKHATGLGGGKSRKLLKFSKLGGHLTLCGMLPPYFKTKIAVGDVDRVDAKWCCVVVHAKGRSPLRLEVDSFATADTLRVGLMAASRMKPPPPPPPPPLQASADDGGNESQPPVSPDSEAPARRGRSEPDPEQGLSSVRPGHHQSQVYDPDAALSVAALLAKEMEEERMLALGGVSGGGGSTPGGGVWASSRPPAPPGGNPPTGGDDDAWPPKPLLKRSASMNSVVSSRLSESNSGSRGGGTIDPNTNRRSLPRGYGGHVLTPRSGGGEELVVVDSKASLRRLYDAIEGRGMVAIKRNPNGKGRSRVMVRSRIKENSIGWSHVLPPFSRKFISVKELLGAHRSSRTVTVNFKNREAVMFETDKLTDALILEQGFVSLAMLQKNEATRS